MAMVGENWCRPLLFDYILQRVKYTDISTEFQGSKEKAYSI